MNQETARILATIQIGDRCLTKILDEADQEIAIVQAERTHVDRWVFSTNPPLTEDMINSTMSVEFPPLPRLKLAKLESCSANGHLHFHFDVE